MIKSVMLAPNDVPNLDTVPWPMYCSPKLDGIRCHLGYGVLSRNMKAIPNDYIRTTLESFVGFSLDGEICIPGAKDFNEVQSLVMSKHGTPNFVYYVFDNYAGPAIPFEQRFDIVKDMVQSLDNPMIRVVPQHLCHSKAEALALYNLYMSVGFERCPLDGVILKAPGGAYKFGRATQKQNTMHKLKPFDDDEGVIVGFRELMHNEDTSTKKLENMVPGNTLGAFIVQWKGVQFDVGSGKGFTQDFRKNVWSNREYYLGKQLTFRFMGLSHNGIPRIPTYKAIRHG